MLKVVFPNSADISSDNLGIVLIQSLITKVLGVRVCFNTYGITFERDCEETLPENTSFIFWGKSLRVYLEYWRQPELVIR
jgi:hypothetical protein